jgi:hypothetical protein
MCSWVGGGNAIEDLDAEGGLGDGSEERFDDFLTLWRLLMSHFNGWKEKCLQKLPRRLRGCSGRDVLLFAE